MDEQYVGLEQSIKDIISNGYMFNTRHETVGKVIEYDPIIDMYLYKDNLGDFHYEVGINIVGNKRESNWVETVSATLSENVKSNMRKYGINVLTESGDLKSLTDILVELHEKVYSQGGLNENI